MANQKKIVTLALIALAVVGVGAAVLITQAGKNPATDKSTLSTSAITEGVHYRTLQKPLVSADAADGKIAVQEFFWYGCPHCQAFEPEVKKWLTTAAEDISFQAVPVAWNEATRLHAALFFVAESATDTDQLHAKLFEKIIDLRPERNLANQLDQLSLVFADHGIDSSSVAGLVVSEAVEEKVANAEKMMRQAEVSSTPTVLVDGKWAVLNNEQVGSVGTFEVINSLVQMARNSN